MKEINPELLTIVNLMQVHQTEGSWYCDICPKVFNNSNLSAHDWRLHMVEHFKDKLINKIDEMNIIGCSVCDIRKMDKASLMYHLTFVHKGIDEHLISEVSKLEKGREDSLMLKIENCSKTRIKMKRKSDEQFSQSKKMKIEVKPDFDLTDCVEEIKVEECLSEESVLRNIFNQGATCTTNFKNEIHFTCDICDVTILESSCLKHLLFHLEDDLKMRLKPTDRTW